MLSHLSYWPWIIGAIVAFVVMCATMKRTIGEIFIDPNLATVVSGAVAVCVCGLIEASNTGVFVDRGVWDILVAMLGLALTSLLSSAVGGLLASYILWKRWEKGPS